MKYILYILIVCSSIGVFAQGDGPRAHLLAPTGVWTLNPKYLNLNQNLLPGGTILVQGLDITVNVFPTTFVHSFGIKGKMARVYAMVNPGSLNAKLDLDIRSVG